MGGCCNTQTNMRWGAEGKLQPKVLLGFGRCKSSTWRVRNLDFGVKSNSAARMGFRLINPEETIARERH